MSNDNLLVQLNQLIEPVVTNLGYELYHIELVKEEGEDYLRVYIDSDTGISLQDCESVSRPISALLDTDDPIPFSYYLEVSSPGIFRTLFTDKHLNKSIGSKVDIELNSLFNGSRNVSGILFSFNDNEVTLKLDDSEILVPRDIIKIIAIADYDEEGTK